MRLGCSAPASSSAPDVAERMPQALVRLPADEGGALVGRVQAEDHPHRGGLAGPVRADEAGHLARAGRRTTSRRAPASARTACAARRLRSLLPWSPRLETGARLRSSRLGAVFGPVEPSPLRGTARIPGQGDAAGPACGDNEGVTMATGRTRRRIVGSPSALALAGRAARRWPRSARPIAQAVQQGRGCRPPTAASAPYAVALCLLALATTVPLIFLRPAPAAAAITAASVLSLTAFGQPTVAGLTAQVIASYRLGRTAGLGRAAQAGAAANGHAPRRLPGGVSWPSRWRCRSSCSRWPPAATARPPCCSPRWLPAAVWAAIARRARAEARGRARPGRCIADTLTEHLARGERARIARELHDVVAHHISMIAVQAETARLTTPGLPGRGGAAVRRDRRHRPGRADRDAAAARRAPRGRRRARPATGTRSPGWRSWPS